MNAICGHLPFLTLSQIMLPESVIENSSSGSGTMLVMAIALLYVVCVLSRPIRGGTDSITTGCSQVVSLFVGFWLGPSKLGLAVLMWTLSLALHCWLRTSVNTSSKAIACTAFGCGQILVLGMESEHETWRWILAVAAFLGTLFDMLGIVWAKPVAPPSTSQK